MIIIFDLDDTLYKRDDFVNNGLKNASDLIFSKNKFLKKQEILNSLKKIYHNKKIKNSFNFFLKKHKIKNIKPRECIYFYRYGKNNIKVYPQALSLLKLYKKKCYLVTDGSKLVQKYKIKNLKIEKYFKKILITNTYRLQFQKPSLHCFRLIKNIERCKYKELVYIGDNPKKDFLNCNKVGINTIRLVKGEYKNLKKKYPYDAKFKIKSLSHIRKILKFI